MKYYKQCLSNPEETGDRNVQGIAFAASEVVIEHSTT